MEDLAEREDAVGILLECSRQMAATFIPASCCLRMAVIRCSKNLLFRMAPSL